MSRCALVLAAGESTRMGKPKPLLEYDGEFFLERILRTLARLDGVDTRLVVLGHKAADIRHAVHFHGASAMTFRGYRQGMMASLIAGVRMAVRRDPELEALMVCHVDQPMIEPETYAKLFNAYQPRHDDVVIASYRGEHGHPVILGRDLLEELLNNRECDTLRDFIEKRARGRRYVDADDPGAIQNINTPEAYQALNQPEETP
jgi:CTP:molybdopterin cytidylyltransferase MocA